MNELDKLKPEVLEAVERVGTYVDGRLIGKDLAIIRAELVRLAEENETMERALSKHVLRCAEFLQRTERAESELAALKRRIAESPVGEIVPGRANSLSGFHVEIAADCLWHTSKHFRLLLDDGDGA